MPYKKITGIYKIKNIVNGKVYIGSSVSVLSRMSTHKHLLLKNKHFNKHLQSSYNKYGINNFLFEILEKIKDNDKNLIKEREEFNILYYKSNNKNFGYNSRILCDTNLGIKFTKEHIEKLKKSHLGIRQTKESIKKIKKSLYKRVYKLDKDKNIIDEYESIIDASEKNNLHRQSISSCCVNKLNSTGGYYWCFINDYNDEKLKKLKKIKKFKKHIKYIYENTETGEKYHRLIDVSNILDINNVKLYYMFSGRLKNKTKFIRYEKK